MTDDHIHRRTRLRYTSKVSPNLSSSIRSSGVMNTRSINMANAATVFRNLQGHNNLRTAFERIIDRSGKKVWPKLSQNLRMSGVNDIANRFPGHVCDRWNGHCAGVADQHYKRVLDEHFRQALEEPAEKALQNALHPETVLDRAQDTKKPQDSCFPESCGPMPLLNARTLPPRGLEPLSTTDDQTRVYVDTVVSGGAKSGAHEDRTPAEAVDPWLAFVVAAWGDLDEDEKKRILQVIREAAVRTGGGDTG